MKKCDVGILMGSKSDLDVMKETGKILKNFSVSFDIKVLSAHRTPQETVKYVEAFTKGGGKVFICGAGMSAALAGTVAAHTHLPVVGVPLDASSVDGMDALLATAQMPPGTPVGAVAIGKPGAKNAAFLAIRILALSNAPLTKKIKEFRDAERDKILKIKITNQELT